MVEAYENGLKTACAVALNVNSQFKKHENKIIFKLQDRHDSIIKSKL